MHNNLHMIKKAMGLLYKPCLEQDTSTAIKNYRNFLKSYRAGHFEHVQSWDCGRQDSWYESVCEKTFEMRAYILALALKRGDTRRIKKLVEEID